MDVFFETLRVMGIGMTGIFAAITIFFGIIRAMERAFPK